MDLFDFITEETAPNEAPSLCPHAFRVGASKSDAWTFEADEDSPYFGHWVHSDPNCRRPAHLLGKAS